MSNPKSLNELNEEIQKLKAKQLQLNEDLYDRKITKSQFVFGLVAFVISLVVLTAVASIVWPAALILSALSAMFLSKIAHAVSNITNSFITGVRLDRAEKELNEQSAFKPENETQKTTNSNQSNSNSVTKVVDQSPEGNVVYSQLFVVSQAGPEEAVDNKKVINPSFKR
ncbi:hypothetical protein [Rickettsiella endosymbiont of Aleochara curtula]|uniref:hypothetical protein n=1 Tax=Rickettsiella endosymbiont of Aleochara curtula TaxID=3077936 RepID=UPI00313B2211